MQRLPPFKGPILRKIAHERQCLIVGFGPQVVVFVILPLQGRCRARSAGRRGVPAGDRGIPLRQHFVLPPPLPGEDERGRACPLGVLCLRSDPASLRPELATHGRARGRHLRYVPKWQIECALAGGGRRTHRSPSTRTLFGRLSSCLCRSAAHPSINVGESLIYPAGCLLRPLMSVSRPPRSCVTSRSRDRRISVPSAMRRRRFAVASQARHCRFGGASVRDSAGFAMHRWCELRRCDFVVTS